MTELTIPDGVSTIGTYAFLGCTSLPEITIPDEVTTIGAYAFSGCTGLTKVTMPITAVYDCKTNINYYNNTFYNCKNVSEIHYTKGSGDVMVYDDHSHDASTSQNYSLPGVAKAALTTVTLEEGITEIPNKFLYGCSNVEGIVLPSTLKTIGYSAFYNCKLGPETELPAGLESIGSAAF